jgi:hypothetical protein
LNILRPIFLKVSFSKRLWNTILWEYLTQSRTKGSWNKLKSPALLQRAYQDITEEHHQQFEQELTARLMTIDVLPNSTNDTVWPSRSNSAYNNETCLQMRSLKKVDVYGNYK